MKVYLDPETPSRGVQRVKAALIKYAPEGIEVVDNFKKCDLAILHIWGRHTTAEKKVEWLKSHGKKYAMIQYCLKSTMRPEAHHWLEMWKDAKVVWSYYDLPKLCKEELVGTYWLDFPFYYAPLGVDSIVFDRINISSFKPYKIVASSQHALSESVRECAFAVKAVGGKMFHVGHELRRGDDIICEANLTDRKLAITYALSEFVSGLRREEGFELPVIEGLLCGARPIVFDRPEMRHWFGDFAVFIEEGTREEVIESLKNVFLKGATPVTESEKESVRTKFDWEPIIKGFWERVLWK